jgi:predicted nucleic acid-binding protein
MRLLLDTNILSKVCHPKSHQDVREWLASWFSYGRRGHHVEILISPITEYEMRRSIELAALREPALRKSLQRADDMCATMTYVPLEHRHFLEASRDWARARADGRPTASERDVDWDILIARQAIGANAIVVTENTRHLLQYGADARPWNEILPPAD